MTRTMRVYLVAVLMTMCVVWTAGNPVDTTTGTGDEDLPDCYMGMDATTYQCVLENAEEYLHCDVEATKRCKCADGLVCRRDTYVNEAITQQQCKYHCVLEDPVSYGMKSPLEWNENMERIFK